MENNEGNTQNASETSSEETKSNEQNQSSDSNQKAGDQSTGQQDTVDYKKLAEDLEKELEQARFKLKEKNIEEKKKKEVQKDFEEEDKDEQSVDANQIEENILKKLSGDVFAQELSTLTQDADEQKLIELYYENKIVKSGYDRLSIKKDLEMARFLANKPRIEKMQNEIKKKSISDAGKTSGGGSGSQAIESDADGSSLALSDDDKRLMQKFGITEKDIKN